MESVGANAKGIVHKHCTLMDKALFHAGYWLIVLKSLYMYTENEQLCNGWWEPGFSLLEWRLQTSKRRRAKITHVVMFYK
jgi:hypothetical protein